MQKTWLKNSLAAEKDQRRKLIICCAPHELRWVLIKCGLYIRERDSPSELGTWRPHLPYCVRFKEPEFKRTLTNWSVRQGGALAVTQHGVGWTQMHRDCLCLSEALWCGRGSAYIKISDEQAQVNPNNTLLLVNTSEIKWAVWVSCHISTLEAF